jgi:hypothetical protein
VHKDLLAKKQKKYKNRLMGESDVVAADLASRIPSFKAASTARRGPSNVLCTSFSQRDPNYHPPSVPWSITGFQQHRSIGQKPGS